MKKCKECKYFIDGNREINGDTIGCCSLTNYCVKKNKEHDCSFFNIDLSGYDICYNCKYYRGGNDWGLFCSYNNMYHHLGKFNDKPCIYYIKK